MELLTLPADHTFRTTEQQDVSGSQQAPVDSVRVNDDTGSKKQKETVVNRRGGFQKRRQKRYLQSALRRNRLRQIGCGGSVRSKIVLPTKFLLGGNIGDPLNLTGLCETCTVDSSSIVASGSTKTEPRKEICIPYLRDVSDPLNLNCNKMPKHEAEKNWQRKYKNCPKKFCRCSHASKISKANTSDIEFTLHRNVELDSCVTEPSEVVCQSPAMESKPAEVYQPVEGETRALEYKADLSDQVIARSTSYLSLLPADNDSTATFEKTGTESDKIVSPVVPQFSRKRRKKCKKKELPKGLHTTSCGDPLNPSEKVSKDKFSKGNYLAYYGYRNESWSEDPRLELFSCEMFEGKDVLDIGCNSGFVTLTVARDFGPRRILGVDIDSRLIVAAKRNIRHFIDEISTPFPMSMKSAYGPVSAGVLPAADSSTFPCNVLFQVSDYVPDSDDAVDLQREEYDVILALSVTKWMHLNHGDVGLCRVFRRVYQQLRPGGKLVLEAQPWSSYKRKKKLTEKIFEVFKSIQFFPDQFNAYLLSPEVGFESCQLLGTPQHKSKGFQRSIYIFTKKATVEQTNISQTND